MNMGIMSGFGVALTVFTLPILGLFWMYMKGMKQGFNALIGACVYFNFYLLLFATVFISLIGSRIPQLQALMDLPFGKAAILVFVGGICCEGGRYLGLRFGTGGKTRWIDAVGLGIGYGFAQNLPYVWEILRSMAAISLVQNKIAELGEEGFLAEMVANGFEAEAAQEMLDFVHSISFAGSMLYCIQIVSTYVFAIALSLLVLGFLRKDVLFPKMPYVCLWLALAAHILTDGVPSVLGSMLTGPNKPFIVAVYMILLCGGCLYLIRVWIYKFKDDPFDSDEEHKRKQKKVQKVSSGSIKNHANQMTKNR